MARSVPNPGWTDGQKVRVSLTATAPPAPPVSASKALPVTGFKAMAGNGEVELKWDNPNYTHSRSRPRVTFEWEYQQRAGSGAWGAWTAIRGYKCGTFYGCRSYLGPYETAVVRGLDNGTTYSFRVRSKPHRISYNTVSKTHHHVTAAAVSATPRDPAVRPRPPRRASPRASRRRRGTRRRRCRGRRATAPSRSTSTGARRAPRPGAPGRTSRTARRAGRTRPRSRWRAWRTG